MANIRSRSAPGVRRDEGGDIEGGSFHAGSDFSDTADTQSLSSLSSFSPTKAKEDRHVDPVEEEEPLLSIEDDENKYEKVNFRHQVSRWCLANSRSFKFVFAALGICISYMVHGVFTEDVFTYVSPVDGRRFRYAWLMQFMESCTNVFAAFLYRISFGGECDLPIMSFFVVGSSQLFAKTFTSLSLAAGLSFPVCTLSKSAKMVPVMIGQIAIGGSSFTAGDYIVAAAIVCGTVILSVGDRKDDGPRDESDSSTFWGVAFILLALVMDGVTAGLQVGLKATMKRVGKSLKTNDMMLWANLSMAMTASVVCGLTGDWVGGWEFLGEHPAILRMVLITCVCSVIGQSFIFYMVTEFDPLACSTVTTSRKIMTVLWSISAKGHTISGPGAFGVALAIFGLLMETRNNLLPSKRAT